MSDLIVDPEFRDLLGPLSESELTELEKSLIDEGGARDPIIVWANKDVIVDGHNRYRICQKHGLKFKTKALKFSDRDEVLEWILVNQHGRRNVTDEREVYNLGLLYRVRKNRVGRPKCPQSEAINSGRTSEAIAEEMGTSKASVERAEKYADEVDSLAPDVRESVLNGEVKVSKKDVGELAKLDKPKQRKAVKEAKKSGGKVKVVKEQPADETPTEKCPVCARDKWKHDGFGYVCSKCNHPHGEPAGDPDEGELKTLRQKTVKTCEALTRCFDDMQTVKARTEHREAILGCKSLLEMAREWK